MSSTENPIYVVLFCSTGIDARAGSTIHQPLEVTIFLGSESTLLAAMLKEKESYFQFQFGCHREWSAA